MSPWRQTPMACVAAGVAAWMALTASPSRAQPPEPKLRIELKKPGDSAEISVTPRDVLVSVTSPSGIGGATLHRPATGWPARVAIRLKLKGLESLVIDNGALRASGSFGRETGQYYWNVTRRDRESAQDSRLAVTITKSEEAITVVLPKEVTAGNPDWIRLEWIDFFR